MGESETLPASDHSMSPIPFLSFICLPMDTSVDARGKLAFLRTCIACVCANNLCTLKQDAFQQNERKKKADSADVVLQRMQQDKQPKAAPSKIHELTAAEAEKENGNAAFKKSDFEKVPICCG